MCIEDAVETEDEGKLDPIDLATPQSGCYVIYTSGSWNSHSQVAGQAPGRGEANFRAGTTGTPKGVDVTHSNVANLVSMSPGGLGIRPSIKVGQVLNISFDMGKQTFFIVYTGY